MARKFRFTAGIGVLSLEGTDFWLEYRAEGGASSAVLGVVLHGVWEGSNLALPALARRKAAEDRLKVLTWDYINATGLLEIDYGTAYARSLSGITLTGLAPAEVSSNVMLEYDLEFSFPLAQGGLQIARSLQFAAKPMSAQNFILHYIKPDETTFQPVFRAAPIRIPGAVPLKTLRVTAIKQSIPGANDLARRQAVEAEFQDWSWNLKGNQGLLIIDGVNKGTFHLRDVIASDLSLPDAIAFELEFVTGYGV